MFPIFEYRGLSDVRVREELFAALAKSRFRSRFSLGAREQRELNRHRPAVIRQHAARFVNERLAPAAPVNDGKQTPMRRHPVFIAQHATATCCRNCLARWHRIPAGRALSEAECSYVCDVIMAWLEPRFDPAGCEPPAQRELF